MKYRFEVRDLDCANCANKIEIALNRETYIEEANLNFMLKRLDVVSQEEDIEGLRAKIEKLAGSIEKGVKVLVQDEGKVKPLVKVGDEHTETHIHGEAHEHVVSHIHKGSHGHIKAHIHGEDHQHTRSDIHEEVYAHTEAHTHEHNHEHHDGKIANKEKWLIVSGIALLIVGSMTEISIFYILAYLFVGYDIVIQAGKNLLRGRMLDENFLMTLATIAAFAIGQYPEAVAVMLFYKVGEYMQGKAVGYSRKEIAKAMDIRPDFARVVSSGKEEIVKPQMVQIGDILEIRVGEKLPLDGVIIEGKSLLDTSMLTGEAVPTPVEVGSEVLSGSINKEGILKVKVTTSFKDSTVSKILELIENATSKKSKSENFITKFARWYTPIVVGLAIFTAIVPSLVTGNWQHWIYSSIVFLVISCPCAVVVSVPLGFFAGLGASAHKGVLVKGSNYLEELNHIDTVVLDKTGTITKGKFGISHIIEMGAPKEVILKYAASLEQSSNHPIARSIVEAYREEKYVTSDLKEISGEGIVASINGEKVLAGNEKLMARYQVEMPKVDYIGSYVYIAKNQKILGCIIVADQIKEDSKEAIQKLKARGIKKVVMLTGDKKEIAEEVGKNVGVDQVFAELLPQDKVARLEEILQDGEGKVAFVGDGINDAPVLARADIGIAMGGVGSDAAIEAADVVLMSDELSSISDVLGVAKRTRRIVTQNIVFALGVKILVMLLSLFGIANMWLAIFADVGVSLIAVMNSIRVLGGHLGYIKAMMMHKE
ncbi:MAG: cadmium-translocating P-type ATPase [Cellulosilyticum sp.]|nr:cadmium-translocating P-type ATPase [Cellulosilyticum sp.]